jgi:sulfite reductase (ferredoxin)
MSTTIDEVALSEAERIKLESLGLRGPLPVELSNDSTHLTETARQLLKFHGSYQQEDRDQRRERKRAGLEPAYQFMIRSKLPGGSMTGEQYLLHDHLADKYGNGTIRITTRQGFQLYGVLKKDLRSTIHELNEALVITFGACGDVVRNTITCPAPIAGTLRLEIAALARTISNEMLPRSTAYHDIWVEGEKVTRNEEPVPDPLYRDRYLPRKFKIAFAFPDDNCTDVLANDVALIVVEEEGRLLGFNVAVGGGMGSTHGKADTYPRLASPLAYVEADDIIPALKAIIAVQRDYGNREDRRRARLKYLLDERGTDWFREQVEAELGRSLAPYREEIVLSAFEDHLGWHDQRDGRWFRGIWVENGRIQDKGEVRLRTALRTIVQRFNPAVHLTTHQNLLLTNIDPADRGAIDQVLREHGVIEPGEVVPVRRFAMACPAIPTCPLAVAESERVFPGVVDQLVETLAELGIPDQAINVRMTGCPNGCARPYTAELAFVGRSLGKYVVYLGGNEEGTRMGTVYADLIPLDRLVPTVRPLLERFRDERLTGERFGDFWNRVGFEPLPVATRAAVTA